MPTIRDLILKSILIFLLCQHAVNAADKWPSEAEKVFKERFNELGTRFIPLVVQYEHMDSMITTLNEKLAAAATLNATLLEGEAREQPTLRHLMEERERLRAELDEWKTAWRQLEADGVECYADLEGAIRSRFSLPAQKDSDEDGAEPQRHAVNATNHKSLVDQYLNEYGTAMQEFDEKLQNLRETTLYNLTENEIQEPAKELIPQLSKAKAAVRHGLGLHIDILEFEFGRSKISEIEKTLEQMLREKKAETNTALEAKEEMKRALEAKEAETKTTLEAMKEEMKTVLEAKEAETKSALEVKEVETNTTLEAMKKDMKTALEAKEEEMKRALESREAALQSNQHKLSEVEEKKAALEKEVGEHGGLSWPMYLLLALAVVLLMLLFVLVVPSIRSRLWKDVSTEVPSTESSIAALCNGVGAQA